MNTPRRNRARVLTPDGLKKLREQLRSHEVEQNAGFKYTLERLGELTGLDPETVKNVLDCKGSDKRTIARCFESFGLTLADGDHIPATQAVAVTADPNFVGRDEAIADLNALVSRNARVIVIQARGGVGKTTLARKYLQQEFGSFLEFPIAKETKDIASIEGLIEEKLRQLGEEPGREFLVSLDRLKRKLQAERIGVLIDNLEPALDSAGKFIEAHRRYVELLRVLSDPTVQSITLITSRERLREADVTVQHYSLRSLDVQAWEQFFQSRSIDTEISALAALHNAYGGNAKAMDIISGAVLEDFSGDIKAYWQANQADLFIERDLEDLVTKQFDRLQHLATDAYNLLCRMGCYRYQDVLTVPIEGLFCLLWDVPENRHRRVIKSLQDRSLVDCENGEFWLHPVIRAEAIARLKNNEDWKMTNQKAAEFWTEKVRKIDLTEDAVKALEALYHYYEIKHIKQACSVIARRRNHKSGGWESLGGSFYRLSIFNKMISAIKLILESSDGIDKDSYYCQLYNALGNMYWFTGYIHKAIEDFQKALEIAENFGLREAELVVLLNIGLCKFDLGELGEALDVLQTYGSRAIEYDMVHHNQISWFCLSPLYFYLGNDEEAFKLAEQSRSLDGKLKFSDSTPWDASYKFLFLGLTYSGLGDLNKSFAMYQKALDYSRENSYLQVEGKALTGMAELARKKQCFSESLSHHSKSIEILRQIGAKCDLAESHFQLGLTYQAIDEIEKSNANFQEAIRLFSEMEAPKQVERVRQSMQNSK